MQININRFLKFCKGLKLNKGINILSEPNAYEKSNKLIYWFVFLMSAIGKQSCLQMDQEGRLPKWKKIFRIKRYKNSRLRNCVVSDSTISERMKDFEKEEEREILCGLLKEGFKKSWISRTAIIDGSKVSGEYASYIGFITKNGDCFYVDVEGYEKRGKELEASKKLLERVADNLGKGQIEMLLLDALYFNESFWESRQKGYIKEILIKYTPKENEDGVLTLWNRKVIKSFEQILQVADKENRSYREEITLKHSGYFYTEGIDYERKIKYKIWSVDSLSWDNRFKVAKVYEESFDEKRQSIFYIFTTKKTLSSQQMRVFAKGRWTIENNGFKMFNLLLRTKKYWNRDWEVLEKLLLIFFAGFNMLWLFRRYYYDIIKKLYRKVKVTTIFVSRLLQVNEFEKIVLDTS